MQYSVYLSIEGPAFDPEAFNRNLPISLRGEIKERQYMRPRAGGAQRQYWRSKQIDVDHSPDECLAKLLVELRAPLAQAVADSSAAVSAQIVTWQDEDDELRGYCLSKDIIHMLASIDADLDIDVVHNLQSG